MKCLREISLTFLIIIIFTSGITYAQNQSRENIIQGVEYAILGKFQKAKEHFEKALKISPTGTSIKGRLIVINDVIAQRIKRDTAIHIFSALSYSGKKQYDLALQDINKAIETDPKYAIAYSDRADIYNKKGQTDQAIQDYTKAIEIDPKYAIAYDHRADIYNKKGQTDQAIQDYTKAIEIDPKYAGAYISRGNAYAKKRKFDKAIKDNTKAIEIDPKETAAYFNRGIFYLQVKSIAKGCADFKKVCELGMCRPYNTLKKDGHCKWWKFWE